MFSSSAAFLQAHNFFHCEYVMFSKQKHLSIKVEEFPYSTKVLLLRNYEGPTHRNKRIESTVQLQITTAETKSCTYGLLWKTNKLTRQSESLHSNYIIQIVASGTFKKFHISKINFQRLYILSSLNKLYSFGWGYIHHVVTSVVKITFFTSTNLSINWYFFCTRL